MGNELCLSYPSLHSSAKQEILVGGQSWKLSLVWITGIWRACEKFLRTVFTSFSSLFPVGTNFSAFSCDLSQKSSKMWFAWRASLSSGPKSQHLPGQCICVPRSQMFEVHFVMYQGFVKTHAVAMRVTLLCTDCLWAQCWFPGLSIKQLSPELKWFERIKRKRPLKFFQNRLFAVQKLIILNSDINPNL